MAHAASTLEDMTTLPAHGGAASGAYAHADDETDPDIMETARLAQLMPADETQLLYSVPARSQRTGLRLPH
jgi:DNA polymerase-3 subunit gamma/tau